MKNGLYAGANWIGGALAAHIDTLVNLLAFSQSIRVYSTEAGKKGQMTSYTEF